ncbi:LacI family DNA-binding transcriptional regulator [Lichenihabitans sp. Uapishka_5]|uniref:LacI family DNA-binding transcriptional regulator n=1 Tax=Lichenihabitans sp. Uapishka_5 TaxID=3037302 RepID=UPI0029E7F215|nr:LacI family DNA-binding transcriptional regulator [Lichenihabitans sp. Uapishka_5]MDX7951544.1 LacI family DNA-binding transcriptional regulator [Lichenihabitans sp. Uapishka_5]
MARKPTIQDVATLAGVSIATADRVLNRRGGVVPAKESRVLSAARRLKLDRRLGGGYAHRLRVAVLIEAATNPFHAALGQAFAKLNATSAELNLQFLVHHLDPNRPERIPEIIDRLARQHDGLVVASPAGQEIAAALRRAAAAIPVATLATDIPDSGRQAYVGPDDLQAGRVAGDLMGRFLGPTGGDVLMVTGLLSMFGQRAREAGFRSVLAQHHPACRVVAVEESRETAHRAGTIVATALRRHPGLAGLYLTSAGADAVVASLMAAGRPDVVFITHELTEDRRALLQRRAIHAVVDQDAASEVQVVADTMARLLGRIEGDVLTRPTPVRIYTAENC